MTWRIYKRFIKSVIIGLERLCPYYLTLVTRHKKFDTVALQKYPVYSHVTAEVAIVMQGPILEQDHFTLETLKLYRHVYPHIKIILSTGAVDDSFFLQQVHLLGVRLVQNEPPSFKGIANVNMQISSTMGGINAANDTTTKFVLKTRSDQRCCKPVDFISYMIFLQQQFPLKSGITTLEKRLIIISLDTLRNRLYGITDMFMFGTLADMQQYWNVPFDTSTTISSDIPADKMIQYKIGEGYFVNHFFERMHFVPDWTKENSDDFIGQYFCVVDKEQLDLFWLKYNRFFDSLADYSYQDHTVAERTDFSHWTRMIH